MNLLKEERQARIVKLLKEQKKVGVSELSQLFNTSGVTVRRDLENLEREGFLHRTYGGAVSNDKVGFEFSFREKMSKFAEEKEKIGKFASTMVADGDTVIIESGTTCLHLAKNIKDKNRLTVVTNALDIISELHSCRGIKIIVLGGIYMPDSYAFIGSLTEKNISGLYADKVFLGTNGLSLSRGITAVDVQIAAVNRVMIESAKECIVITDHSKIGRDSFAVIAPLEKIDKLIVDSGIRQEDKSAIEERGVEVIVV